ncbi:MAG: protein translocase subunit SecF [Varibaculum sp.]|nr:protein translocase subunit SecF [Varibaculum sp.]
MISYAQWGNELYSGKRSYNIVGRRKVWLSAGLILIALSIVLLIVPGLSTSIEFRGGSEFTINNPKTMELQPAREVAAKLPQMTSAHVSTLGTTGVRVQTDTMTTSESREATSELAKVYGVTDKEVTATQIGPSWGQDVTNKALKSLVIFIVLLAIMLTIYFRTWTMSAAAVFALCHDLLITGAVFAVTRVEVSPATVIGLLTILAYSLYDTVVVFDKVRELTSDFESQSRFTLGEIVNLAVNQTMVRSINTSVVAILPIASIFVVSTLILGGGTLRDISMALLIGTIIGTWSSIFIASPALVFMRNREKRIKAHNQRVHARRTKTEKSEAVKATGGDDDTTSSSYRAIAQPLKAGQHQGQGAQPHRKPRSKR